ncbi:hypothetical protein [Halosimplex pelagicum]|uniref:Uncharacterized protein n=1 Tax=Halosimplex pelagicum TaxID=869886 RepID=A0A7D5P6R6_9EURY|nr:hypothetical protein [Halosimplex pelagicum]QLH82166.1 hypothetical protein HZS54_11360 [Halosimplex pelagicum]
MSYKEYVELSWRIFDAATLSAEIMGWAGVLIGSVGFVLSKSDPARHRRFRGLLFGGAAALVAVLFVGGVYESVTYVMTGQTGEVDHATSMYPELFLQVFNGDVADVLPLAGILSQVAAIIGMAAFVFGVGLWGVTKRRSVFNGKSQRIIYGGLALMAMSVGERLLAAGAHILISYIAIGT